MKTLIAAAAVLVVIVLCAIFRVNVITLLPWFPGAPKRLDDRVQTLGSREDHHSKPDSE
jgi:hypothetical protein